MRRRARHALCFALALAVFLGAGRALSQPPDSGAEVSAVASGAVSAAQRAPIRAQLGLSQAEFAGAIERRTSSHRSDTTHVHLRQRVHSLEVVGGDLGLAIDGAGRVFSRWNHFVKGAPARVNTTTPQLSAEAALTAAALFLPALAPAGT